MKIISKIEVIENMKKYINEIKSGKIFIYPTDTIYGLGCNALNSKSVIKIREIKNRELKPFSIIAPSKKWIKENCELSIHGFEWLNKIPGKYTFIFKLKNKDGVCKETNNNSNTIGVRIPKNWFTELINKSQIPFVTTSVNCVGKSHATSLENIEDNIKNKVDYFINEGKLHGKPSTVIDLTNGFEVIRK